jgi:hypothetical protein
MGAKERRKRQSPRREARPRVLRTQREVLCDVLLSAGQCETWLTLHELALLTGYGEASVSAQLRHLRKPEYGGFTVEKRLRGSGAGVCGQNGPLWEYRLRRGDSACTAQDPPGSGLSPVVPEALADLSPRDSDGAFAEHGASPCEAL